MCPDQGQGRREPCSIPAPSPSPGGLGKLSVPAPSLGPYLGSPAKLLTFHYHYCFTK